MIALIESNMMSPIFKNLACLLASFSLLVGAGCLRQRWQPADESFRDLPAIPKQNFGRPKEQHAQAGLDNRARQIESSLGIDGDPPRLFER